MKKDNLFGALADRQSFSFDAEVAEVFDDMAIRSIPGYAVQQQVIAEYACGLIQSFATASSSPLNTSLGGLHNGMQNITQMHKTKHSTTTNDKAEDFAINSLIMLDVGCSTGQSISSITRLAEQKQLSLRQCKVIATDYSPAMLKECKKKLSSILSLWQEIDIQQLDLSKSEAFWKQLLQTYPQGISLININFVLQFISRSHRAAILQHAWDVLRVGGVLLVAEKTYNADAQTQNIWQDMQYLFKRQAGYSDLQIESKKRALDGVLVPEEVQDFESQLKKLLKDQSSGTINLYYAHGEFRCYALSKRAR